MVHIELAAPVAHIWFLKSLPSRIGLLLDMTLKDLERIRVLRILRRAGAGPDPAAGPSAFVGGRVPQGAGRYGGDSFTALIGAEAIREMLKVLDLQKLAAEPARRDRGIEVGAQAEKARQAAEADRGLPQSGNKPEWMILTQVR